jgi:acetolactate synthase-1/2/3 large subunit
VGVCVATSGPGATNLITGLATAHMDSSPVVAITGQVSTTLLGRDGFQEADVQGITIPITKHNYLVTNVRELPAAMKEAFYIARTNRPGPVVVDLPKDLMAQTIEFDETPQEVNIRGYRVLKGFNAGQVISAAEMIQKAKRPLIYAGGGVVASNASSELTELAEKMKIPVTTTLMGIGCFPGNSSLSLGMLGMHGTRYANYAVGECDLLIAVGARFDDRVTGKIEHFAPHATVIHIDIDAAEIGKNVEVDVPIVGEVKEVLKAILQRVQPVEEVSEWNKTIDRWKEECPLRYGEPTERKIMPQQVVEEINQITNGEALITTEVGQNQMWAAQYIDYKYPRTFLSSGGLGTMGWGLPAAIGAAVARPDMTVIDIAGDGSIQMNIQELGTAVQYNLPVIICILNNHFLGMVRQWQGLFYGGRYSFTDMSHQPDFVKLAEAYGAVGIRVTEPGDIRRALLEAMQVKDRPVVLDFWVEREADVYPMVPPGESIANMLGGDE